MNNHPALLILESITQHCRQPNGYKPFSSKSHHPGQVAKLNPSVRHEKARNKVPQSGHRARALPVHLSEEPQMSSKTSKRRSTSCSNQIGFLSRKADVNIHRTQGRKGADQPKFPEAAEIVERDYVQEDRPSKGRWILVICKRIILLAWHLLERLRVPGGIYP